MASPIAGEQDALAAQAGPATRERREQVIRYWRLRTRVPGYRAEGRIQVVTVQGLYFSPDGRFGTGAAL